jgi:hypothetical protein
LDGITTGTQHATDPVIDCADILLSRRFAALE